ncbi:ABC transporter substrate-binding protein [Streptomyces sp. NPDC006700]|uniref:ABC transporter substrate-binding protein n=1 Tax=Streptomyces sp. NPDC006700 TaxID=3154479 RepID=UPI003400F446
MTSPRRSRLVAAVCLAAAAALAAGCSKEEGSGAASSDTSQGAQVVQSPSADSSGPGCTLEAYGATKIDLKDAVVGFSQSEKEANPFRIAETQSIKDEAARLGVKKLLTTNAQSQLSKQISDIKDMLAQGAQLLIVAPLNSDGLEPALQAAAAKHVPVITVDRKLNATACKDYVAFLGSDFVEQGKRAADAMIQVTGGKGKVAILLGASGNNVTTDRTKGFVDQLKAKAPGLQIVAQQTGEFARDKGQQVMEQLIQSKPDITAVYAENDEMGLGAVTALKGAGKKPGKDVRIISIDGTRNAVQALADSQYNGVIESNPRFGPLAFATAQKFFGGESIPENVIISDRAYDASNAKDSLSGAY